MARSCPKPGRHIRGMVLTRNPQANPQTSFRHLRNATAPSPCARPRTAGLVSLTSLAIVFLLQKSVGTTCNLNHPKKLASLYLKNQARLGIRIITLLVRKVCGRCIRRRHSGCRPVRGRWSDRPLEAPFRQRCRRPIGPDLFVRAWP